MGGMHVGSWRRVLALVVMGGLMLGVSGCAPSFQVRALTQTPSGQNPTAPLDLEKYLQKTENNWIKKALEHGPEGQFSDPTDVATSATLAVKDAIRRLEDAKGIEDVSSETDDNLATLFGGVEDSLSALSDAVGEEEGDLDQAVLAADQAAGYAKGGSEQLVRAEKDVIAAGPGIASDDVLNTTRAFYEDRAKAKTNAWKVAAATAKTQTGNLVEPLKDLKEKLKGFREAGKAEPESPPNFADAVTAFNRAVNAVDIAIRSVSEAHAEAKKATSRGWMAVTDSESLYTRDRAIESLTWGLIAHSDGLCKMHHGSMYNISAQTNIILGSLTALTAGAATVVSAPVGAPVLAASAGFLASSQTLISKEAYRNQVVETIIKASLAGRKAKLKEITDRLGGAKGSYSLAHARSDVEEYHNRCSFYYGMVRLSEALDREMPTATVIYADITSLQERKELLVTSKGSKSGSELTALENQIFTLDSLIKDKMEMLRFAKQ